MSAPPDPTRHAEAAASVLAWMERRDWRGHDPFDLLLSPLAAPLRALRWPAVAWVQLGRRSPVDLRGALGVPPHENPKALALGVQGGLDLAAAGAARVDVPTLVGRLLRAGAPGGGWGYPFPWANRHFRVPAGAPSSVVTAFAGHALLDAADAGVLPADAADQAREAVRGGCAFIESALARIPAEGGFLFSYTGHDRRAVHNASLLAASLLAREAATSGRAERAELARRAASATLAAQRPDGSWPYGTSARDDFVDSFHTGYVLHALRAVDDAVGLAGADPAIRRGLAYWRDTFLTGPAVGHRPGRPWPVDLHALAQGILTCLEHRDLWPDGPAAAARLADWAVREARRPDGAFVYLWTPRRTNRVAYLRWVQAWMFRALAALVRAETRAG